MHRHKSYYLEKFKLSSLKLRRMRFLATEICNILNKRTPVHVHDLVNIKTQIIILSDI